MMNDGLRGKKSVCGLIGLKAGRLGWKLGMDGEGEKEAQTGPEGGVF
jgi:hypothetical protein